MGFKAIPTLVGFTDGNVNTKNTGATLIFTNPNSSGLYFPFKVRVYAINIASSSVAPTISIGSNASSYNNILTSTQLTGLTTNGTFIDYPVNFPANTISTDLSIFVNVSIAATATNFACRFAVFMDYF